MPLSPGNRLGPYEILALIGTGGMGEVHRARDTRLEREVAIKVLPAEVSGRNDLRQRFEREARAIRACTIRIFARFTILGSRTASATW
jgi:serine/threonine protein kinase